MADSIYKKNAPVYLLTDLVFIRPSGRSERVEDYPFKGSLPYMDIQALESGRPSRYAEGADSTIDYNDLVMVKDGHRSGKVFHGQEGISASTLTILSPKMEDLQMDYLYCYLAYCYDDFQSRKKGTTVGHLDMNFLRKLHVPLPDVTTQQEIAEKYQRIEALAVALRDKALRLTELSVKLGNKELKTKGEELSLYADMTAKAWLHQIFGRSI